jgi:O-antigen ligase
VPSASGAPSIVSAAPDRRRSTEERGDELAFWGLMTFTFILFIGPQFIIPALQVLRPAMVSAGFATLAYGIGRLTKRQRMTLWAPVVPWVLCFVALAVASIPTSHWPGGSVDLLTDQLLKSLLVFFIIGNTVSTVRRAKVLLWSMALWSSVMALVAIRSYASGNLELDGIRILGYDSPLAMNPNDLALTLNIVLSLTIGLWQVTRRKAAQVVLIGAMALMVGGVIASFSRAGFLTLVAIGIVLTVRTVRQRGVAALAFVMPVVFLFIVVLPGGYGTRLNSIFDSEYDMTGSREAREHGIGTAMTLIAERPLLGQGLGQQVLGYVDKEGIWTGAHNLFLGIGADLGIPAMVVYALMLWALFRMIRRSRREAAASPLGREAGALAAGVQTALIAYVVGAQFGDVADHFYSYYIAGLALALSGMTQRLAHMADVAEAPIGGSRPWWQRRVGELGPGQPASRP